MLTATLDVLTAVATAYEDFVREPVRPGDCVCVCVCVYVCVRVCRYKNRVCLCSTQKLKSTNYLPGALQTHFSIPLMVEQRAKTLLLAWVPGLQATFPNTWATFQVHSNITISRQQPVFHYKLKAPKRGQKQIWESSEYPSLPPPPPPPPPPPTPEIVGWRGRRGRGR